MFASGYEVAALLIAALTSLAATPLAARIASKLAVVAPPRPDRWGSRHTPLLGGLALVGAALLPILYAEGDRRLAVVAIGTLAALILGLIDDVRGLRPTSKIVGQAIIASGLAFGGVTVEIVDFPPISFVLTLIWVIGIMNAVNLIDNMDGLAAGVCGIASAVLLLMAPAEPEWVRFFAAALAGSCLGFLMHNLPPARVYMGDAGSMSLGFLLAALTLILTNAEASNVALAVLGPLLVLGLPIFDTALVTVSRRLEGRPVGRGGRDHTSHRLAARGLSERTTVFVLYAIAASLALLGLLSKAFGLAFLPFVGLVVVGLAIFGAFLFETPEPAGSEHTAARTAVLGAGRTLVRFGGEITVDITLATIALFSAYLIRFESLPTSAWLHLFVEAAPIIIPLQLGAFLLLGVYRILWSYLSISDLLVVLRAAVVGTAAAALLILYALPMAGQSRAVLLMDGIILMLLIASSRLFLLWLRDWFGRRPRLASRRVLIVGASEKGELVLRLMLRSKDTTYHLAGFLDDDPGKQRRRIAGVPVLGRVSDLSEVAQRASADLVVVAIDQEDRRELVREGCARLGIELRELSQSF